MTAMASSRQRSDRLQLVLATNNPDKVSEIAAILSGAYIDLLARPEELGDVAETGSSLEENARIKARAVLDSLGAPSTGGGGGSAGVADDTGLEVAALGGAPGVLSSRYAGPGASYADNVSKLLAVMRGVRDRRARFRTVALVAFADGREVVAEGSVNGVISEEERGKGGFGYDPVFIPDDGGGLSFAEMEPAAKNALSHRGRAFRTLAELLSVSGVQTGGSR